MSDAVRQGLADAAIHANKTGFRPPDLDRVELVDGLRVFLGLHAVELARHCSERVVEPNLLMLRYCFEERVGSRSMPQSAIHPDLPQVEVN